MASTGGDAQSARQIGSAQPERPPLASGSDFAELRRHAASLKDFGERQGDKIALLSAADYIRRALAYEIDTSLLHTELGNILIRCAYLENAPDIAREAHTAFTAALREYEGPPDDAFAIRAQLNVIESSNLVAALSDKTQIISLPFPTLNNLIHKLRDTSFFPDHARAEALLGDTLLNRYIYFDRKADRDLTDAIHAYENAVNIAKAQVDRAIDQTNLANALREAGAFDEAIKCCEEASFILQFEHPVAWTRAKFILTDIWIAQSIELQRASKLPEALQLLNNASDVIKGVLEFRTTWPPAISGSATARLAKVNGLLAIFGPETLLAERLTEAVNLYHTAIPNLPISERVSSRRDQDELISLLRRALPVEEYDDLIYNGHIPPPESADTRPPPMADVSKNRKARIIARIQNMPIAKLVALEKLLDDFETTQTATTEPSAKHAVPSSDALRAVTADELFGNIPPEQQVKQHQKYTFAPELLADPEALKRAVSIVNARRYKIRKHYEVSPEEDARGKMAASFVQQATRRQRAGAALPRPTGPRR